MADKIALVTRLLSDVESAGEARAAIASAQRELEFGRSLVGSISRWASPTPDEASDNLTLLRGALDAELRGFGSQADDSQVDPQAWARAQRQIIRVYVDVSGIEGVATASIRTDTQVTDILAEAIADAPRVFGQAIGAAAAEAGKVAGAAGGGLLSGLGFVGVLVLVLVMVVLLKSRGIA